MDSSGNHDGWRRRNRCRRWQRRWATAAQWATGRRRDRDGQWDSDGVMDSKMGSGQSRADEGTKMGAMFGFWLVGEL